VIEFSFNVRETTKCVKQLKTLLSEYAFKKPIPLGYTCFEFFDDFDFDSYKFK
jgi:hypothetical protein